MLCVWHDTFLSDAGVRSIQVNAWFKLCQTVPFGECSNTIEDSTSDSVYQNELRNPLNVRLGIRLLAKCNAAVRTLYDLRGRIQQRVVSTQL